MRHRAHMPVCALAVLAALALAGCAANGADSPEQTVDRYFAALGRDPVRTLPLLSDRLHRAHGLHVVTSAQARGERGAEREGDLALDRLQLGWLAVQGRAEFHALRERLVVQHLDAQTRGDRARVSVRVGIDPGPAFEQHFELVRQDGCWRVDAIEQLGVKRTNRRAAFAAFPNERARGQIEQLGGAAP